MFNIGPVELLVLAFVGLVVLGPDRLPGLARDAGRLLRSLRDMATGARTQLREELGPEFADIDLRSLNPRTAITQALLGDDVTPASLRTRGGLQRALLGGDTSAEGAGPVDVTADGGDPPGTKPVNQSMDRAGDRPLGRAESAPFDNDAT